MIVIYALAIDEKISSALAHLSYVMLLHRYKTCLLHVVDGDKTVWVRLVLFSHQQEPLVWRQLHASDLLDVLGDHDEVHLADIRLIRGIINVADRNMVSCQNERIKN